MNHVLSSSTFYEFRISRYKSTMKQYVYEDPTQSVHWLVSVQADSAKNINAETFDPSTDAGKAKLQDIISRQGTYSYVVDPNGPAGYLQPNSDGGYSAPASYSYNNSGMDPTHTDRSTAYWAGKLDMTSQINKSHEIKCGLEARLHELTFDRYRIISATDANGTVITPFVPAVPDPSTQAASALRRGVAIRTNRGEPGKAVLFPQKPALPPDVFNSLRDARSELENIFGTSGFDFSRRG